MNRRPDTNRRSLIGRLPFPAALRYRDFRLLWAASIAGGMGTVAETVLMGWALLELSDSPLVVGLGIALRALPNVLFGVPAGALADRVDRRIILQLLSTGSTLAALLLAVVATLFGLAVWQLLAYAFLSGTLRAFGQAARQSYAFDVVGPQNLVGGTSMMNLSQRLGGVAGALGAGAVLDAWNSEVGFLLVALCQAVGTGVLLLLKSRGQSAPVSRPAVSEGLREFAAEVRRNRALAWLVALTAAVEVLGFSYQALMPSIVRDVLGKDAEGLGQLLAVSSAGGLATVLLVSMFGELRHKGLIFLIELHLFGLALILLGQSQSYAVIVAAVMLVSGLAALTDLLSQSLIQAAVPNDLRGRAMGSWVLAIGFGPIGHLQIGFLASLLGVAFALSTNGIGLILLASAALFGVRSVRRL